MNSLTNLLDNFKLTYNSLYTAKTYNIESQPVTPTPDFLIENITVDFTNILSDLSPNKLFVQLIIDILNIKREDRPFVFTYFLLKNFKLIMENEFIFDDKPINDIMLLNCYLKNVGFNKCVFNEFYIIDSHVENVVFNNCKFFSSCIDSNVGLNTNSVIFKTHISDLNDYPQTSPRTSAKYVALPNSLEKD